ncbi:MAG: hypothetical protein K2X43_01230 [Hyphomonadaceae bacterium]|jgi:hypothetical protein|nr:hypothetical protein [Hyphomonadaceae bacterium]
MNDTADAATRALVRIRAEIEQRGFDYRMELPRRPTARMIAIAVRLVDRSPGSKRFRKRLADVLTAEALHQVAEQRRKMH